MYGFNKLQFLVRKISKEEAVNGRSCSSDRVLTLLCERHVEYLRRPMEALHAEIQEIISEAETALEDNPHASTESGANNAPVVAMSLNRGLVSTYQKKANPAKEESKESSQSSTLPSNGHNHNTPSAAMKSSSKKRRLAKGGEDLLDSNNVISNELEISFETKFISPRPSNRLAHLAGIDSILSQIEEMIFNPLRYPALYAHIRVFPPTGLLLLGPSGVGKTSLALAIAGETGLPFFKVSGPALIGGTSGDSESNIRRVFAAAAAQAPSILFIDSIDAIAGIKESSQRGMDRRIIAQFFECMDSINSPPPSYSSSSSDPTTEDALPSESNGLNHVILIAAVTRADSLDPGECNVSCSTKLNKSKYLCRASR